MQMHKLYKTWVAAGAASALLLGTGCRDLPGSDAEQGAVVGGLGGAIAGAAIGGEDNRLLGAILGGALGAGGGYVVGANADRITGKDRDGARRAVKNAQERPATAQQALSATTADLNNDGFVTMDEVVAMEKAGLSDNEITQRLDATDQIFELTSEQKEYLRNQGVSYEVVSRMNELNRDTRERILSTNPRDDVIGRPPAAVGGSGGL